MQSIALTLASRNGYNMTKDHQEPAKLLAKTLQSSIASLRESIDNLERRINKVGDTQLLLTRYTSVHSYWLSQYAQRAHSGPAAKYRLPEKVRHNVMVPFGAAAFFPGQLVNTNTCMVKLGEPLLQHEAGFGRLKGTAYLAVEDSQYYVEQSAKQTGNILDRRKVRLDRDVGLLTTEVAGCLVRKECTQLRSTKDTP